MPQAVTRSQTMSTRTRLRTQASMSLAIIARSRSQAALGNAFACQAWLGLLTATHQFPLSFPALNNSWYWNRSNLPLFQRQGSKAQLWFQVRSQAQLGNEKNLSDHGS